VDSTWALDAWVAATGTAEPTRIDPAMLSARIAGMTTARFMRMIPSMVSTEVRGVLHAPSARTHI